MTARRSAASFAAAVSRTLASGGRRPLPSGTSHAREGLRVRGGVGYPDSYATVSIDIDSARVAREASDDAVAILTAAGYTVRVRTDDTGKPTGQLTVTRPAPADPPAATPAAADPPTET